MTGQLPPLVVVGVGNAVGAGAVETERLAEPAEPDVGTTTTRAGVAAWAAVD